MVGRWWRLLYDFNSLSRRLLDAQRGPYETFGHAQSAPNNFLGIHLHDSQFYLNMGAWTAADLHATYAHGNVLMWHGAMKSPMYQTSK